MLNFVVGQRRCNLQPLGSHTFDVGPGLVVVIPAEVEHRTVLHPGTRVSSVRLTRDLVRSHVLDAPSVEVLRSVQETELAHFTPACARPSRVSSRPTQKKESASSQHTSA